MKLLLITISPVQSFIAQARKIRDLHEGSSILSELIKKAIDKLQEIDSAAEIIFPSEKTIHKPNRFLAKTSIQKKEIQALSNQIQDDYLTKAKGSVQEYFTNNKELEELFLAQVNSLLEIQWACVDLENYNQDYKLLGKYLASLKAYRGFKQISEEGARKCALCGERNALFYRARENSNKPQYILSKAQEVLDRHKNLLTLGEGLCGVCFVKRISGKDGNFDSTAAIASANLLNQEGLKSIIDDYKKVFQENWEAQLLYKENLTKTYFEKHALNPYIKKLPELQNKLSQILQEAKKQNLKQTSYYALLLFDGDSMGKTLSGEFFKPEKKEHLQEFHKKLSECLGNFAEKCRNFLGKNLGQTIYAGGDDFLGFINLSKFYEVLKKFLELFDEHVNNQLESFLGSKKLTYSAGVIIAHYKTPLSEVLKWARQMEKKAKGIENKSSLGLAVLKHSGDINSFAVNWKFEELHTLDVIQQITKLLREDIISNTFIKKLQEEFLPLEKDIGSSLLEVELERLILRSLQEETKIAEVKDLSNKLKSIHFKFNNFSEFCNMLNIADFISRQV